MRLTYKEIELKPEKSFLVRRDTVPCIEQDWHFHKELELIYFLKSTGTRYVGNSIDRFQPGELYLIGSDLPHLFRNDKEYYEHNIDNQVADVIVVKFVSDFLGSDFISLTESQNLKLLFEKANRGLKFSSYVSRLVHDVMIELVESTGMLSVIGILGILDVLSSDKNCISLCPEINNTFFRKDEKERMAKIISYLTQNFDKKIELEKMASIAHMTPNSFCRYFKKQTQKSFSQYLNEIRIRNACKLLIEGKLQITTICYQSGFNTITNFNRQFRTFMNVTPSEYMKKFQV
ncbi:AraC family transcriptional regulator [Aquimarina algiphila]|uniref:AraC family transcriptional regulator n=1 Tax=Aquimarina algiphila TaxID=2047982 RepID=UPI00232BF4F7|nr:AraC family transcriptional regulator [Aquimarina algiphila]